MSFGLGTEVHVLSDSHCIKLTVNSEGTIGESECLIVVVGQLTHFGRLGPFNVVARSVD